MDTNDRTGRFVHLLTSSQSRIYTFIVSLLGDADRAHDVLQNCNLVLWQKAAEYDPQRDFVKWACGIAYHQVRSHRRDAGRDRLVFGHDLMERLAERVIRQAAEDYDARRRALHRCMSRLKPEQQAMLLERYGENGSVQRLAQKTGRSAAAMSQALARLRRSLLECLERTLAREARP